MSKIENVYKLNENETSVVVETGTESSVTIAGTFGGALVTPFDYSRGGGQGVQLELDGVAYAAAAPDGFNSKASKTIWVVTGATATTDISIIVKPLLNNLA